MFMLTENVFRCQKRDQMARLSFQIQYLALYNNDLLPNSIKSCQSRFTISQIINKPSKRHKILPIWLYWFSGFGPGVALWTVWQCLEAWWQDKLIKSGEQLLITVANSGEENFDSALKHSYNCSTAPTKLGCYCTHCSLGSPFVLKRIDNWNNWQHNHCTVYWRPMHLFETWRQD